MTKSTFTLTQEQLAVLQIAVNIADDRLDSPDASRAFTHTEISAVKAAVDLVRCGPLFICQGLDEEQVRTDLLWNEFWAKTDVDYSDWFHSKPEALDPDDNDQPRGWVKFRDEGLTTLASAKS